jgi:hypothetical protein
VILNRDYALSQLLVQAGVNQFLLKVIYARLHQMEFEEVQKVVKEVEDTETAYGFQTIGKYALDSNLSQLLKPPRQEDLKK